MFVCVCQPLPKFHIPRPSNSPLVFATNRILNAYFMEPPFCANIHKNAPTQRPIIINHFITHDFDADAAPTSHVRACKSGCYYRLMTVLKKRYTSLGWSKWHNLHIKRHENRPVRPQAERDRYTQTDIYIYIYIYIYTVYTHTHTHIRMYVKRSFDKERTRLKIKIK